MHAVQGMGRVAGMQRGDVSEQEEGRMNGLDPVWGKIVVILTPFLGQAALNRPAQTSTS